MNEKMWRSSEEMMSDRNFRDRLARIADNIDLEQLDGLIVNRIEPSYATEEDQPSLQRLFQGLEENNLDKNDPLFLYFIERFFLNERTLHKN